MDEDEALIAWLADTTGSDDLKGWSDVTRARAVSELLSAMYVARFSLSVMRTARVLM